MSVDPEFAFTNEPHPGFPRHLHFALTSASLDPSGRFLLVNFTTDPKSGCPSLVVEPGEYSWLSRPSMLAFVFATTPAERDVEAAMRKGLLSREASVPGEVVARVRMAFLASRQAEPRLQTSLRERMGA